MRRLAAGVPDHRLPGAIERMARLVSGRGACAHPDGSARFIVSTLQVFAQHVTAHLRGRCPDDPGGPA
jgi:NADH:ubiquinone oxidoreductase subunit F (NADH-binding)